MEMTAESVFAVSDYRDLSNSNLTGEIPFILGGLSNLLSL
jgi:hypothetical protein